MAEVTDGFGEPRARSVCNEHQRKHTFGKEDAEIEQVIDAGKAANAHNFISQLPQGYDTQVKILLV